MKIRKVKKQRARELAELETRLARREEELVTLRKESSAFRNRTEKLLHDTQKSLKAITANNHRMLVGILQERIEVFLDKEREER